MEEVLGKLCVPEGLFFWLGLLEADDAVTVFPLTALLEQVDTLEAFQDCAILFTATAGGLKAVVLGHDAIWFKMKAEEKSGAGGKDQGLF